MKIIEEEYIYTTIHEFKANISKYIRILERKEYKAVVVYRRNKRVGMFIPLEHRAR